MTVGYRPGFLPESLLQPMADDLQRVSEAGAGSGDQEKNRDPEQDE